MVKAIIGIGTNMGDRFEKLQRITDAFSLLVDTKVIGASSVYETAPVGYDEQQDFYNSVLVIETEFSPSALLGIAMGIEAAMGRKRTIKNGPRVADIDILLYGQVKMDTHELTLPHPRMLERRFVLEPMKELFPDGRINAVYFNEELSAVSTQALKKTDLKLVF